MATQLGDAHEEAVGQPDIEKQMDLWNNAQGRSVYISGNSANTETIAKNLVYNGALKYIDSNGP